MAKKRDLDLLQDFRFHLFDVSPKIPSLFPFVLNPSIGFSMVTAPLLSLDKATITPGNAYYPHKVIKRGTPNTLVCQRGAYLEDGDFWRWYLAALTGESGSLNAISGARRNLLLVHFSLKGNGILSSYNPARVASTANLAGAGLSLASAEAFGFIGRIPSRAWLLYDCQPAGYRPASDLSASSPAISLRELQLDYSDIDEIDLGF